MGANITAYLPAAGLSRRVVGLDLTSGSSSQEELNPQNEAQANGSIEELDAYKVAVLLLVAAVILSLCL